MLGLEQVARQLFLLSTYLLEQCCYNLMKVFQLCVLIIVVSKAETGILSQSEPRRNVFYNVFARLRLRSWLSKRNRGFPHLHKHGFADPSCKS